MHTIQNIYLFISVKSVLILYLQYIHMRVGLSYEIRHVEYLSHYQYYGRTKDLTEVCIFLQFDLDNFFYLLFHIKGINVICNTLKLK